MDGLAEPFVKRGTGHPMGERKSGLPTGNPFGPGSTRNRLNKVIDSEDVTSKSVQFSALGADAGRFDEDSCHVGCVLESQYSP